MHRAIVILFLFLMQSYAAVYYVRTDGHDAASGANNTTSETTGAWQTIDHASDTVVAGDIVRVQAGTYSEQVTESTDGTAAAYINYVADGAVRVQGGFIISGDYVRLTGFLITHTNNVGGYNYETVLISGSRGSQLIDCVLEYSDKECVTINSTCSDILVRGCTMKYSGYDTYPWATPGVGSALFWVSASSNVVAEYNDMSYTDDFFNGGTLVHTFVMRNNHIGPNSDSAAHCDTFQDNGIFTNVLFEANWDHGVNLGIAYPVDGAHHSVWREGSGNRTVLRGNVIASQGGTMNATGADCNYIYNNTWHTNWNFQGVNGGIPVGFTATYGTSLSNVVMNNIFAWSSTYNDYMIYETGGSSCQQGYNLTWQNYGFNPANGGGCLTNNPLFVSGAPYTALNLHLQAGSPAISAAGAIAMAVGSGSGTSITVSNAWMLWDGDVITIGSSTSQVATVDSKTAITLATTATWSDNDPIRWIGNSDMGALPYGSADLTGATISSNSTTYTVSVTGTARFVSFYSNGIPWSTDSAAPYSATITDGTVTAKAYALYAQGTNVFNATDSTATASRITAGRVVAGKISGGQ